MKAYDIVDALNVHFKSYHFSLYHFAGSQIYPGILPPFTWLDITNEKCL